MERTVRGNTGAAVTVRHTSWPAVFVLVTGGPGLVTAAVREVW
ncbi:hypothetical protein KEM60_00287 [Austwickia sp. TVS 96-490-7B]|nr:hypothetical protein [Austwickia sp. TVS 96-490-7B]